MTDLNGRGLTEETLRLTKEALGKPNDELAKTVSISTGLTAYDLQAPAKNIYPTITPIRNKLPRVQRANPGDAARWRSIFSITGSGYNTMGWVPEGQRSASMSYQTVPKTAPYFTLGEEDSITFEAERAATGFEDVNATATMRLLQKTMRKEEFALLGGNSSIALGTPTAPTLSASGTGATLPAATYSVIAVALTFEGYSNASVSATGVPTQLTITGNDGGTFVLNGGSSNKSANTTQAVSLGQTLFGTVPPIQGAAAFAWYIGLAGAETLQAITTLNSIAITAPLLVGNQPVAAITTDNSRNQNLAFDGILSIALNPANSGYVQTLGTGTAGTGTFLTASGRGSVNEIDAALIAMWNISRLSPTVIYVNAQEQKNITAKCLTNASGPLVRYNIDAVRGDAPQGITAGGVVRWYYNPFSVDGGKDIPILVHPDLPPGTILLMTEVLPEWYQSNEIPNVLEVLTREDYHRIDWPLRTRRREFGVYVQETLACYAPFAFGIINNIGNG